MTIVLLALLASAMAATLKVNLPTGWSMSNIELKPYNWLAPRARAAAHNGPVVAKPPVAANPYLCQICVTFIDDSLDLLLQIILQQGVLGECSVLCGYLPTQLEAQVCNLLCDVVGVMAFVDLLQETDPDPIAMCEELDQCGLNPNAAANITVLSVSPRAASMGTTFTISLDFVVTNEIATGELVLAVLPPSNSPSSPLESGSLLVNVAAGGYSFNGQVDTSQTSSMMSWSSGTYQVVGQVCSDGSCGSPWEGSRILSQRQALFQIN